MKFLKWLVIGAVSLVVLLGVGLAVIVNLVDWNNYRDTIQAQAVKHTGRELTIAGDLSPSFFPWAGISIGGVSLANAEGFPDENFAQMDSADVKVKILPLLKREVNISSIELHGLAVNLQRNADGTTNWDDLANRESTTTTETDEGTTAEVEGNSATVAALSVGGINITNADVNWVDNLNSTDVQLSDFALQTGTIELDKPFDLTSSFNVKSNSMGLQSKVNASAQVALDLENQVYELTGLALNVDAAGEALPNGALAARADETIDVSGLVLKTLGIELSADAKVTALNTEPVVVATASSNTFNPSEVVKALGVELPPMADASVMSAGSLSMNINASPASVAIDNIVFRLDDSNITGSAAIPDLAAANPPVRFDLTLDAIDADRYLPPVVEGEEAASTDDTSTASAGGDTPIELPLDTLRTLDIAGGLQAGRIKVANLVTTNLSVPIEAKNGKLGINGLAASLYQGQLTATTQLDATGDVAGVAAAFNLGGIQAEPLLQDLTQGDAPISGAGDIAFDITTGGASVNAMKAALNGSFSSAFTDGAVNGINIGYQLRRAKAFLSGQKLAEQAEVKKTDFSSLSVSGQFTNGVMNSTDLDLRSPLLRIGGAGLVDLPGEAIDYTTTIKVTTSTAGQGGADLESLNGLSLDVPVKATFAALAANPASVIFNGVKDNISGNLKKQAEALAKQKADKLKAEAQAKLDAEEARARERLAAEQAKVQEKLNAEKAAAQEKVQAEKAKAEEKLKNEANKAADKLKKGLGGLFGN